MSDEFPAAARDVRMRGFDRRAIVEDVCAWIDQQVQELARPCESVRLADAAGRVLAEDVQSEVDVPGFARSMMDGFALRADDTSGASPYNSLLLDIVGLALPGKAANSVGPGQAVRIMTGAPLPPGADAVLPVERVEVDGEQLRVQGEVSPGKHVGRAGEDIEAGQQVLSRGRRLRPQDLGVLSSIGVAELAVVQSPRVRIIVTGDELLPAGSAPSGHQITDANGPMLQALVRRDGGLASNPGIVPDQPDAVLEALRDDVEVVLVSGGSSVGQEDHAPVLLAAHGQLAIHGIAMRPSSPAGMGRLGPRLVFLLPGNPVSCLCAYDFFAGRAIRQLAGREAEWPYRRVRGPLARKLVSVVGRVDYARVRRVGDREPFAVTWAGVEPVAISGASVLSSTTRADGFVIVPADSEGFPAGAEVDVFLYDPT